VVEKDRSYFHPVGNHWPVQPPNYIGFRYRGCLQSVHRVAVFQVVRDVATVNSRWCTTDGDHFVYSLGPPMRPARTLALGPRPVRLDTLLSGEFDTLAAARDETQRRQAAAPSAG
jgi:hypothetical protein